MFAIVDLVSKQQNFLNISYVDNLWYMHLNCANLSDFAANGRLNLSISWWILLYIYAFWWLTGLCSIVELFSCLRWKTDRKLLIHNHLILAWAMFHVFCLFFFITTYRGNDPYQRTVRTLRVNEILFSPVIRFHVFMSFQVHWVFS